MSNPYDLENFFCSGPWAVVDGFYGTIWINVEKQHVAKLVSSVFGPKLNSVVVDISQAKNYHPTLIDNSVSLNWILPTDNDIFVETLPYSKSPDETFSKCGYSAKDKLLINEAQEMALSWTQRKEIQLQVFSFISIIRHIWGEVGYGDIPRIDSDLFNEICLCYGAEKNLSEIEDRLSQIGLDYMDSAPIECLFLLRFLEKLYE